MTGTTFLCFPGIVVTKNGCSWSYSYSMKWYSYSKGASETDPVYVPTANALNRFAIGIRP
jgi:hypothetical protein